VSTIIIALEQIIKVYHAKGFKMPLEVMMISSAIDAKKGQYVVLTDTTVAFLDVDMDTDVHMLLEGTISELIVKVEPVYTENIFG